MLQRYNAITAGRAFLLAETGLTYLTLRSGFMTVLCCLFSVRDLPLDSLAVFTATHRRPHLSTSSAFVPYAFAGIMRICDIFECFVTMNNKGVSRRMSISPTITCNTIYRISPTQRESRHKERVQRCESAIA